MRSEPVRLGGISPDIAAILLSWNENFPYEHAQVGQPGASPARWDTIFFNQFYFTFQMLIK